MAFTAEQHKEYRAMMKERGTPRPSGPSGKSGKKPLRPFVAIDGEALGESGYHLLAASTGESVKNRDGLPSRQCIEWLLSLRKSQPKAIFCGFALGYDCEWWIKDFGVECFQQLRDCSEAEVTIGRQKYVIEYIPRKWFKIRRPNQKFGYLVEVYDLFSFFQAGFVSVIGCQEYSERMQQEFPRDGRNMPPWKVSLKGGWGVCTENELVTIQRGKQERGAFKEENWEEIVAYNALECEILVRLANVLRDALYETGIRLRSWHGPGAVANCLLKRYNMDRFIDKHPPKEVRDAIQRAYFGGRFQVFKLGHIEGVYDYDISSAYPYATSLLPSAAGEWEPLSAFDADAVWALYEVSWDVTTSLSPFPWRSPKGLIHYPPQGRGWYWAWEVAAARRGWGNAIRIERGWRLYPAVEGVFQWMNDLAAKRVAAKQAAKTASGDQKQKLEAIARAYKLALNSVYGKTIQTVGKHHPYLCPMWAGLITSHTRSRLLDAALTTPPEELVCFATDGLFSTGPVSVVLGNNLGDWELAAENIRLEIYQSGCYAIYRDGEIVDSRFRGIARSDVDWGLLRLCWNKEKESGKQTLSTKRFIGHRTALARGKPEQQATWVCVEKEIELHPGVGFPTPYGWCSHMPGFDVDYNDCSHPYRKLVNVETDLERDEMEVQP